MLMVGDGGFEREPEVLEGTTTSRIRRAGPPATRWALVSVLVAVGLIGYAVHAGHHGPAGHARSTQAAQPGARGGSTLVGGPAMIQTGATCSIQHGHRLQLGIQVNNQSDIVVDILAVHTRQPVHGLHLIRTASGACGERTLPLQPFSNAVAPAGASIWLTATERVLVRCPGPDPVQFRVRYRQNGQAHSQRLAGFVDLTHVPYTGCSRRP